MASVPETRAAVGAAVMRIAIVGTGPTALYTLQALLEGAAPVDVVLFEGRTVAGPGIPFDARDNGPAMLANITGIELPPLTESLNAWACRQPAERLADGRFRVDMGPARLGWAEVPLAQDVDTLHLPLAGDPAACSMGNPHVTFFVDDPDRVEQEGPGLERHAMFPDRVNVGFAKVVDRTHMRLRVWERGAGMTLACGSGACATAVNAHRRGLTERHVAIEMDGGTLEIDVTEAGRVLMTGPVATSFRGALDLAGFDRTAGAA